MKVEGRFVTRSEVLRVFVMAIRVAGSQWSRSGARWLPGCGGQGRRALGRSGEIQMSAIRSAVGMAAVAGVVMGWAGAALSQTQGVVGTNNAFYLELDAMTGNATAESKGARAC